MKIAIDAMGGDHAPKEVVIGAQKAIEHFQILKLRSSGMRRSFAHTSQTMNDYRSFIQNKSLKQQTNLFVPFAVKKRRPWY
ncbi:MAG: hypothetical protein KatS3mg080_0194 [Anoxybacillus sp.]|nr:MAG: hypothetical protein KatS3mg080_0194 [Anoxybacillus sp.]